ncbi:MAG: hypothetical protein ACXACA_08305 [Candidatus Ranarchaeia archaeon]|jgi:hypothetical protein
MREKQKSSETPEQSSTSSNQASKAWVGSIIFAVIFTFIIWFVGPQLDPVLATLLPDQGAAWYYWKLPSREFVNMLIVWSFYLAHQFSIWGSIYWAQKNLTAFKTRPTKGLTRYNWATLLINAFFIVLHLVQTHIWFDGLAQDVPIITSQGSVIVMLVMILIIEHPPMAYDPQLLTGFFYMFLLFTQASLAYTVIHVDRRWVVLLESFVGVHAFIVAVYNTLQHNSIDMWAMFASGFAFMFVFTYLYAFKLKKEVRYSAMIVYFAALAWVYLPATLLGYGRPLDFLLRIEFLWIPIILYLLAIVFAAVVYPYVHRKQAKA